MDEDAAVEIDNHEKIDSDRVAQGSCGVIRLRNIRITVYVSCLAVAKVSMKATESPACSVLAEAPDGWDVIHWESLKPQRIFIG